MIVNGMVFTIQMIVFQNGGNFEKQSSDNQNFGIQIMAIDLKHGH